jgi:hypothetical protein
MNMSSAFLDPEMGGTTFTVKRLTYTRGSGSDPVEDVHLGVMGSIHPGSPEMLQLLPEEERKETFIYIHSEFAFSTGKDNGTSYTTPDRVIWNGQTWRVVRIRDWIASYGFCDAWAVLMQEEST